MKNSRKLPIKLKVLLLGESFVGKTSLMLRFYVGRFVKAALTTGIEFQSKNIMVNDLSVELGILDPSGTERFHSVPNTYFREVHGVIFIYDINKRESFLKLDNFWLKLFDKEFADKRVVKMLFGNMNDKVGCRQVKNYEGMKWASRNNALFAEGSALTGDGVELLFEQLTHNILEIPEIWEKPRKNGLDDLQSINLNQSSRFTVFKRNGCWC